MHIFEKKNYKSQKLETKFPKGVKGATTKMIGMLKSILDQNEKPYVKKK